MANTRRSSHTTHKPSQQIDGVECEREEGTYAEVDKGVMSNEAWMWVCMMGTWHVI